jgi:hypothetical protein
LARTTRNTAATTAITEPTAITAIAAGARATELELFSTQAYQRGFEDHKTPQTVLEVALAGSRGERTELLGANLAGRKAGKELSRKVQLGKNVLASVVDGNCTMINKEHKLQDADKPSVATWTTFPSISKATRPWGT